MTNTRLGGAELQIIGCIVRIGILSFTNSSEQKENTLGRSHR